MKQKVATIFGGTGFVGRQVVRELAAKGVLVKVATRVPERAYFLKPAGAVGQIVPWAVDCSDDESLSAAIKGSDYVVNCIGILFESGKKANFSKIHTELVSRIGGFCKAHNVERFVHISALGCDRSGSKYAKSKLAGEQAAQDAFEDVCILRPSIIFGEDDGFFNKFAEMSRYMPFLPLIGGGNTKFQPVYVGDVADAVIAALHRKDAKAQIFELGGPEVISFKDVYKKIFKYTGRERGLFVMPFMLAKLQALFMGVLPKPPLTCDQVESLKYDNVLGDDARGLKVLGIKPTAMDVILPTYLESYRQGGRFSELKEA